MLLSEVHVGEGRRGAGGAAAEPLPSSRVQLNDGRVVNVIGNVSRAGKFVISPVALEHWHCMYLPVLRNVTAAYTCPHGMYLSDYVFMLLMAPTPCMYLACQVHCASPVHRLFRCPAV